MVCLLPPWLATPEEASRLGPAAAHRRDASPKRPLACEKHPSLPSRGGPDCPLPCVCLLEACPREPTPLGGPSASCATLPICGAEPRLSAPSLLPLLARSVLICLLICAGKSRFPGVTTPTCSKGRRPTTASTRSSTGRAFPTGCAKGASGDPPARAVHRARSRQEERKDSLALTVAPSASAPAVAPCSVSAR